MEQTNKEHEFPRKILAQKMCVTQIVCMTTFRKMHSNDEDKRQAAANKVL